MNWPTALVFYLISALLGGILSWLYFSYGQKKIIEDLRDETTKAKDLVKDISVEHKEALIDHSAKINMRDAEVALLKKKLSDKKGPKNIKTNNNKEAQATDKTLVNQNKVLEAEIETLVSALDKKSKALVKLQKQRPDTPAIKEATPDSPHKGLTQKLAKEKEIIELQSQLSKAKNKIAKLNKKLKEQSTDITEVIESLNIKKFKKLLKKLLGKGKLTSKKTTKKVAFKKGKA